MHAPFAFHTDPLDSPLRQLRHRRSRTTWLRPCTCALFTGHVDVTPPHETPAAALTMEHFLSLQDAIAFTRNAHAGQRRLDGRAFLSHPLTVLQILLTACGELPREAYVSALLHDAVEDGQAQLHAIRVQFGEDVAVAVNALSRPERSRKTDVRDHEEMYLMRMAQVNTELPYVLLIKMADRLHNLETMHFLPADRQTSLRQETALLYLPFFQREEARQTEYTQAYRFLLELLERAALVRT